MAISETVLDGLGLIAKVESVIDQCYTSWRVAAVAAMVGFDAPKDPDQARQWWIAVAGDLLWAVVVFNPEVSAVVKAASIIGATLGSGLAAKLSSQPDFIGSDDGKKWLTTEFFKQADQFSNQIQPIIPSWVEKNLVPAILRRAEEAFEQNSFNYQQRRDDYKRTHPNTILILGFFLEDKEFQHWFSGIEAWKFVNSFIWDNLLIGIPTIRYQNRDVDLLLYFQQLLDLLQDQFESYQEIDDYNVRHIQKTTDGDLSDKFKAVLAYRNHHPAFRPSFGRGALPLVRLP